MNAMQWTLIKKDLRAVTSNKRLFSVMLIVPLVLTLVMPSIFVITVFLVPEELGDFEQMLRLLPMEVTQGTMQALVVDLIVNRVMPAFFIIIPIMAASVMAASSFVGEKEKHTLETLLYCPLSLPRIFQAKILASFLMSMLVSFSSFAAMALVVQAEVLLFTGGLLRLDVTWLITLLMLAPAISVIAISLIVQGSAKAQTMEESQQRAVFLILPVLLLVVGQFSGVLLISTWLLAGLAAVFAGIAWLILRRAFGKFSYEALLK